MQNTFSKQALSGLSTTLCCLCLLTGSAKATLHTVLIGVDKYNTQGASGQSALQLKDLRYASSDVLAMRDVLSQQGLDPAVITTFANASSAETPSYQALVEQLKNLKTNPDDTVMLVYCGHGINVGRDSYLCFPETQFSGNIETGDIVVRNALSVSELSALLAELPGKRKIILTDACRNYSSSAADYSRSKKVTRYDLSDHLRKMAESGNGNDEMIIISSCLPGQISLEHSDSGHGLFFSQLLDGFSGHADLQGSGNSDGTLSLYEVFQYAASRTREIAERDFGSRQHPFFEGGFTSECDLVSIEPTRFSQLKAQYQTGEFIAKPLGLDEQISIEKYADAVEALGYGDIQRTIELCTEVLEYNPKHQEAKRLRGIAFIVTGDLLKAYEDAKSIGSRLKVRYTADEPSDVYGTGEFTKLTTVTKGDVLEISRCSQKDAIYEKGQYLLVSSIRRNSQQEWEKLSGWVNQDALRPGSVEAQLEALRDYQLESNKPVIDATQGQEVIPRLEADNYSRSVSQRNNGSQRIDVQQAVNRVQEISNTVNEVRGVVNEAESIINGVRSGNPNTIMRTFGVEPPPAYNRVRGIINSFESSPMSGVRSLLRF